MMISTITTDHTQALVTPEYIAITDIPLPNSAKRIIEQNFNALLTKAQYEYQLMINSYKRHHIDYTGLNTSYTLLQGITAADLDNIFDYLNGKSLLNENINQLKLKTPYDSSLLLDIVLKDDRLLELPEFTLFHLFRAFKLDRESTRCFIYSFKDYDIVRNTDLRQVAQVLEHIDGYSIPEALLGEYNAHLSMNKELVWPFFAENIAYLDEALGFPNRDKNLLTVDARNAMQILGYFPQLPNKYVPFLLQIALASTKALREEAQNLLADQQDIHLYAEKALWSNKAEEQIVAAKWLAKIAKPSSINALYRVIKEEPKEDVKAAILSTLQQLGEPIDEYLSPEALLQQAQKGLQTKIPVSITWLKKEMIPALTWQDDSPVDSRIIYWWIVFAAKLKDPKTHPILQCYIKLLSMTSQQQLGLFILKSFITYDTRKYSLEQATEKAKLEAPNHLAMAKRAYLNYPEEYPQYQHIVEQDIIDRLTKVYLSYCIDDLAINCRGILALVIGINGYQARELLLNYIKQYPSRHKQFRYILEAISMSNQPLLLQFLHYISRSYQTSSVKKCAQNLLKEIANRNNWSDRQFDERVFSNVNWNENNQLVFDYGTRQFIATLNDQGELTLRNHEGKMIKTLPAITTKDNASLAEQAKTAFAESKKLLKSLVTTHKTHLYEAMCLQHCWSVSDWTTSFFQHFVINKLINRLIWLELNNEQQIIGSFRPVSLSQLVDHNGNNVTLKADSQIMLAHHTLVEPSICQAWLTHLQEYNIAPLFTQFTDQLITVERHQQSIELYPNLSVDSAMMIKMLHQLNYHLSDHSIYSENQIYSKTFKHADISINIELLLNKQDPQSEKLISASLNFCLLRQGRRKMLSMKHVSPVILSEGYADYRHIIKSSTKEDFD